MWTAIDAAPLPRSKIAFLGPCSSILIFQEHFPNLVILPTRSVIDLKAHGAEISNFREALERETAVGYTHCALTRLNKIIQNKYTAPLCIS